ncbi:extracellular solute-binding protein [Polyangium mundeleinium]|uniref:Extracellular solute-binding protein n=1 Tax=Polyangium mundeleinium TaxID=2995306 RepID=A0ABT5F3D9_9BACT|nr:extracellular solute-binding protein [Polyangium mundeleinium]MDC0748628.1 extracellular solute-binding protein [Polyangium mundeleinium]
MTVALYPFLPDYQSLFSDIEHSFERDHPDVDLQIIDLSSNYYNEDDPQAITNTDAQVYELDGVFLADFIDQKRIQALPEELVPPANTMVQVAENSAKVENEWWGVPHWACTNYLFYRSGDQLESAGTLKDIESVIGANHSPDQGLLVDAKGKSTLGELYLDATLDELGDLSAAEPYLLDTSLLSSATANLQRAISLCDTGMCRDSDYHEATGFYARQFARKRGRALAGYSERLYYIALEQRESCQKGECLDLEDIEMKPLPLSDKGSHPFAWVDMLTISTTCDENCLPDATAFIAHVTSAAEVKRSLLPARYGAPPRYLLPARADMYTDEDVLAEAPLYSKLQPALSGAIPVQGQKLNARLRAIGKKLDNEILVP